MLEIHKRNVNIRVTEILDSFVPPNVTLIKFKHQI